MADNPSRRRTLPPYRDGEGLSRRDQALARVEVLLRREETPPPPDEAGEPPVTPCPVNPEEATEIARLSPPRPPDPGPAPSPRSSPWHTGLQALILLFVLGWVFILGLVIGRGHLGDSGPIQAGLLWLERKIGWSETEKPLIFVREEAPGPEEEVDWEEVRRLYRTPEPGGAERFPGGTAEEPVNRDRPAAEVPEEDDPPPLGYFYYDESSVAADASTGASAESEPLNSREVTAETETHGSLDDQSSAEDAGGPGEAEDSASPAGRGEPSPTPAAAALVEPPEPQPPSGGEEDTTAAPEIPPGRYAVQIATAYEEEEARRRMEKLQSQGLPAYYYRTAAGRYPVRTGRFATRAEAEAAQDRLNALGYKGHYLSTLTE